MKDYTFRKGTEDDKAQLSLLAVMAYGQHATVLDPEHWKKMKDSLGSSATMDHLLKTSTAFVCEVSGQIVGMAFLVGSGHPLDIFEKDWSYIRLVGVHPDHGGNGIARKLTELCIEQARQQGESLITLHTSEFMNAARHLYESLGFKVLREIEPRFGKRYWLYSLSLKADAPC